jgi:hypothetical protein
MLTHLVQWFLLLLVVVTIRHPVIVIVKRRKNNERGPPEPISPLRAGLLYITPRSSTFAARSVVTAPPVIPLQPEICEEIGSLPSSLGPIPQAAADTAARSRTAPNKKNKAHRFPHRFGQRRVRGCGWPNLCTCVRIPAISASHSGLKSATRSD